MFKILGLVPDTFDWELIGKRSSFEQARALYWIARQQRSHQWVALVQVRVRVSDGESEVEVIMTDAPRPEGLAGVEEFRAAATIRPGEACSRPALPASPSESSHD